MSKHSCIGESNTNSITIHLKLSNNIRLRQLQTSDLVPGSFLHLT